MSANAMESVVNSADPPWSGLVEQIRNGDPSSLELIYHIFSTGIRFYLCRQLGPQDLDDRVHDVFLIIVESIQKGELREPERLMGYVRTIVRRQVAAQIDDNVRARRNQADLAFGMGLSDHHPNPERIISSCAMRSACPGSARRPARRFRYRDLNSGPSSSGVGQRLLTTARAPAVSHARVSPISPVPGRAAPWAE